MVNNNNLERKWIHPPDLPDPADPQDQVSSTAARNLPTTRTGGQDDGSYTNSLKSNLIYVVIDYNIKT